MSLKGYASQRKPNGAPVEFATIEPVRTEQNGLSVISHTFARVVATDAAETGSASGDILATGHVALKGDIINVTSGPFDGYESKVLSVAADHIYLADDITLANGNTFEILRHKYPTVDADGNLAIAVSASPILYDLDGVDQEVHEDTGTPANSRPLPVKVLDAAGLVPDFATETTLDTVHDELVTLNAVDFATEAKQDTAITALGSLLTELQLKADLSETQPVSAASLPLPTGAATSAAQAMAEGKLDDIITAIEANGLIEADIESAVDGIETLLTAIDGHVDGLEGLATTLNGLVATEATLDAMSDKLPATLGQKTKANSLAVTIASDQEHAAGLDFADSARKDSGSVTGAAWVELIASTAAAAKGLTVFDSSGYSLELGVGAAASEVRKLIIPPGGLNGFIPLAIPAGSRISIRALGTTADYTAAEHLLTLLG